MLHCHPRGNHSNKNHYNMKNKKKLGIRKIQNGFLSNNHHARFFANRGFISDVPNDKNNCVKSHDSVFTLTRSQKCGERDHLKEISSLESLIQWQKKELQELQEEMDQFKDSWEKRLREMRQEHCEERKKLLHLLEQEKAPPSAASEGEPVVHEVDKTINADSGGASPLNIYHV